MPTQEKFRSGSKTVTDTAALVFNDESLFSEFIFLRAHADNLTNIYISHRDQAQFGYILDPGAEVELPVQQLTKIYASTTAGGSATLSWLGV